MLALGPPVSSRAWWPPAKNTELTGIKTGDNSNSSQESPFWETHLAYKRAPMRKRGPWPHPDTLSFSSLVSFRLNLALEPNSVQLVDQVANTELPSSLPDPSLKPASGKHGFSVAQCPCRHPASSSVRGPSVLFNIGFTKKMSNSIKRKYWK